MVRPDPVVRSYLLRIKAVFQEILNLISVKMSRNEDVSFRKEVISISL